MSDPYVYDKEPVYVGAKAGGVFNAVHQTLDSGRYEARLFVGPVNYPAGNSRVRGRFIIRPLEGPSVDRDPQLTALVTVEPVGKADGVFIRASSVDKDAAIGFYNSLYSKARAHIPRPAPSVHSPQLQKG